MKSHFVSYCFLFAGLGFLSGCNEYALDTSWRSGNYRLIEIDARKQMSLIDTSDKAWEGIGPTVFSIGADQRCIVVARHPSTNQFGDFDRSVTQYFVIQRNGTGHPTTGPLTTEEFERFSRTNALPKLTKTFNDLK
jgi:hypothetical protein